jgi:hypothetical protein
MIFPVWPAAKYKFIADLWIVSCIYNPMGYKSKSANYDKFIAPIQAGGLKCLIVDCAVENGPFNLPPSDNILRIRAPHVLWQKERLLNIAIQHLPPECTKVAWVDCDVVFSNPEWAVETSQRLDHCKVVQPFITAIRLPQGADTFSGEGTKDYGFGYRYAARPDMPTEGRYNRHGHTGYAWAAHKDLMKEFGLYDFCIAGSADHIMAHAFAGEWDCVCVKKVFGDNVGHYRHFVDWATRIYPGVNAEIAYTDGSLLHLWHGDIVNRQYSDREKMLQRFGFDPTSDIELNEDKCWVWKGNRPDLHTWIKEYFALRKED